VGTIIIINSWVPIRVVKVKPPIVTPIPSIPPIKSPIMVIIRV
jgi:hypothetical protein